VRNASGKIEKNEKRKLKLKRMQLRRRESAKRRKPKLGQMLQRRQQSDHRLLLNNQQSLIHKLPHHQATGHPTCPLLLLQRQSRRQELSFMGLVPATHPNKVLCKVHSVPLQKHQTLDPALELLRLLVHRFCNKAYLGPPQ
jgi:hypothetical protein